MWATAAAVKWRNLGKFEGKYTICKQAIASFAIWHALIANKWEALSNELVLHSWIMIGKWNRNELKSNTPCHNIPLQKLLPFRSYRHLPKPQGLPVQDITGEEILASDQEARNWKNVKWETNKWSEKAKQKFFGKVIDLSLPNPDSSLTFSLCTAALKMLTEDLRKWQTNLGLTGYASSPSHDSLKNSKCTGKFGPSIYSVPLAENCQCICHMAQKAKSQSPEGNSVPWGVQACSGLQQISPGTAASSWTKYPDTAWDMCPRNSSDFLVKKSRSRDLGTFGKNNSGCPIPFTLLYIPASWQLWTTLKLFSSIQCSS